MTDQAADRIAIEKLLMDFSYLLDHGRADDIAKLFTPDAVFENPRQSLRLVGRPSIGEYYARRARDERTMRHISTNQMTKPGSNIDPSPEAIHRLRQREGKLADADRPLFVRHSKEQRQSHFS